jgi:hypothetical protein
MKAQYILLCTIGVAIFFSVIPVSHARIIPEGRIYITDFHVPEFILYDDTFSVNVTLRNDKLLPTRVQVRVDVLDGLLETMTKDIGELQELRLNGRSSRTLQIPCSISKGNIDWYKEEYNLQAVLLQKRLILGWTTISLSSIQGVHIKTPLTEKEKLRIIHVEAPEELAKNETSFPVHIQVKNEGSLLMNVWSQIDFIQKPSIFPELEEFTIASGFVSERFELGQSKEITLQPGETETVAVTCYLRKTEQDSNEFTIETQLYTNIQGHHYLVDVSTLQGVFHEQPLLEEHGITIALAVFGILIGLLLIVVIFRIAYPAYYIKRYQLQKEKDRIRRHRRHP